MNRRPVLVSIHPSGAGFGGAFWQVLSRYVAGKPQNSFTSTFDMKAKRLFVSTAVLLVILAAYNVLIHFASKNSRRYHAFRDLKNLPPATDCLFLGNSMVEGGLNAAAFDAAWRRNGPAVSANLGLGASKPVEHSIILNYALSRLPHVKYVVYFFSDDQLTTSGEGGWRDLVGNRAFSYYLPKEAAAVYAPGSRLAYWRLWAIGHVPMLAQRSSLWDKVNRIRFWLGESGMERQETNRYGRVADFTALEPKNVAAFAQRCDAVIRQKQSFSPPVQAIIDRARAYGAKVFFVEMPVSPKHRQKFYSLPEWAALRAHLQGLAAQQGVIYLTASDWVDEAGNFEDTIHLSEQGARAFSAKLATTMSRMLSGRTTDRLATVQNQCCETPQSDFGSQVRQEIMPFTAAD